MVAYNIQFGQGITLGAGITVAAPALVISSGDFNYANFSGGTNGYVTPGGGDLNCPFYYLTGPNGNIATRITDFFNSCGYDINTSYVFNATFASATPFGGGPQTSYSCLVRASWESGPGQFDLTVIDQSNPGWTSGNPSAGTMLQGTFNLPVTLTPYTPTQSMGMINWC
jgi:hypothetical protein